jgi:hypothetical protein
MMLIVTVSVIAGMFAGWFGYRIYVRIQTWGENMNLEDPTLQALTDPEASAEFGRLCGQAGDRRAALALGHQNMIGAVPLK